MAFRLQMERSIIEAVVERCREKGCKGAPLVELLHPGKEDYFVLKPKHSAFFSTTLDTLLRYLGTETLVVGGFAADICVLFTANDAYMRDLKLFVPADCVVSNTPEDNAHTLRQMQIVLKAQTKPSTSLQFA